MRPSLAALLVLLSLSLLACEPVVEAPLVRPQAPVQWRQEADFGLTLALTNTVAPTPTGLWVGHDQLLTEFAPPARPTPYLMAPHAQQVRTPVGRYTAARGPQYTGINCGAGPFISFVSLAEPVLQSASRSLVLPLAASPSYEAFTFAFEVGAYGTPQGNSQRFLTVATSNSGPITSRNAAILLTVSVSADLEQVSLADTAVVPLVGAFSSSCVSPLFIRHLRDQFYVGFSSGGIYRIPEAGGAALNIGGLFDGPVFDVFEGDSAYLYAHTPISGRLWRSINNGLNWEPWFRPTTNVARFRRVGSHVVFFNPGIRDLVWLDLGARRQQRLSLAGFGFYGIQDVALYNGRVYIATWGGGLYSKPLENLLDPVAGS